MYYCREITFLFMQHILVIDCVGSHKKKKYKWSDNMFCVIFSCTQLNSTPYKIYEFCNVVIVLKKYVCRRISIIWREQLLWVHFVLSYSFSNTVISWMTSHFLQHYCLRWNIHKMYVKYTFSLFLQYELLVVCKFHTALDPVWSKSNLIRYISINAVIQTGVYCLFSFYFHLK